MEHSIHLFSALTVAALKLPFLFLISCTPLTGQRIKINISELILTMTSYIPTFDIEVHCGTVASQLDKNFTLWTLS